MFQRKNKNSNAVLSKKECSPSVIAHDMHFLGNVICDGIVDCDGTIEGNIRCDVLTVRQRGWVKGDITADTVMIHGKVNGLIRAKTVQLFSSSCIEGIIMHESISIEDGAFIDGKCKRTDKPLNDDTGAEESDAAPVAASPRPLDSIRLIR